MPTEAVSADKDPVLLGVSLPVSATFTAATQVKDAWLEALTQVFAAARSKANERRAELSKKTNGSVKPAAAHEITA